MAVKQTYSETELGALAKWFRKKTGKTKAALARELGVTRATMQDAEERSERSLTKLRIRIIESCSSYKIHGPVYWMKTRK